MAGMFKALSNPQRLRMFVRLATSCCVPGGSSSPSETVSSCCVGDLGADVELAASTVSHHLKELRQAGLMHVRRRGQRVNCWVSEETLRQLASFFERCGSRARTDRPAADRSAAKGGTR